MLDGKTGCLPAFKASLDKLQIPNTEQKEWLAIVESTRPEIVTVR